MIAFIVVIALLFIVVVGVEITSRLTRLPLELTRKLTHIFSGIIVAFSVWYLPHWYVVALGLLFIAVIAFSRSRGIFRSIHDPNRSGVGELWYPIGILLTAILFPAPITFMYAILILAISDGLAGLIGKLFGRRRIPFLSSPKTYLGSAVFVVSALVIALTIMPPEVAVASAFYLAIVELLSFKGLDNLILPLIAGVIASVAT